MADKSTLTKDGKATKPAPVRTVSTRVALSVRTNSVIFPLDATQLLKDLTSEGFIPPDLPENVRVTPIEVRKGETRIRFDAEKMVLGVTSPNPKDAVSQFSWLESRVKSEFSFDTVATAHYYELVANLLVRATRNPLETWSKRVHGLAGLAPFSELFGLDLAPFGLRLFGAGQVPNSTEWFEVRMEPQIPNTTTQHFIQIIYRSARREMVVDFTNRLDDRVSRLLGTLEQE